MMDMEYEKAQILINNIIGLTAEDRTHLFKQLALLKGRSGTPHERFIKVWARNELTNRGYTEVKLEERIGDKCYKFMPLSMMNIEDGCLALP